MRLPAPSPTGAPPVLGVADFALRKREVYGTVLVDCGSGRPVDLLPDRGSEAFAAWLREHPGAHFICRDRAGAYAEGARVGAPEAVQVADRWHLWHNLGEHVEREVGRYRSCLAGSADELTASSWTNRATILDAYKPYLHQRLNQGPASTAELHRQITARGYRGSYGTVLAYLRALRSTGIVPPPAPAPPTVRQVAGWIMSDPDALGEDNRGRLQAVLARCPELDSLTAHVRGFAAMLTTLGGDRLRDWLDKIYVDTLPSLHAFANGIDRDRDAVIAGLPLPHNSGVVEGHINRIKMLKRQMFGRAGFQLLKQRVLLY